jgi:uncharacterized lipoprotein
MRALALVLTLTLALAIPATAGEPLTRTFSAPIDRVWSTTGAVLKHLGWDIDKEDRTIGFITTDSRSVDGENYGVYAKGTRHKLQLQLKPAGDNRTTVSVERTIFKRERILWMDKDETLVLAVKDQSVEKSLLDTIGNAL